MRNQGPYKSESAHFSIRDAASSLFRHKLLMSLTFLAVITVAGVVTYLLPNQYESRMKILVKNTRSDVPITPGPTVGASGATFDNDVSETQINSEIELLTSKDLLTSVATECGLHLRGPSWLERMGLRKGPPSAGEQIEAATNSLVSDLVITPIKKANIIEIKYSSNSPEIAAKVLRKLQDLYLDKHLKLHRPPGTYEFFKAQAQQYEEQLRESERHFSTFQQTMNVVSLSQQKEQAVQKLTESRSKLLETEAFLREVNDRIAKVEQQLETVQPRVVTQSRALPNQYSAERLNTMMVELQNRRTQLLTKFRPEDRLIKEVDNQIKTTQAALRQATDAVAMEQSTGLNPLRQALEAELARARVDKAGAQGRQAAIASQVQQYEAQISRLEGITAEYDNLARKVKQGADNYQLYNQKEEEARITDELDQNKITNVSIAEAPAQPQIPTKPNRPLNMMLGVVLALILSVGGVIVAEAMRDTFETPRELEALTARRVLASLPSGATRLHYLAPERKELPPPKLELSQPKLEIESELKWGTDD